MTPVQVNQYHWLRQWPVTVTQKSDMTIIDLSHKDSWFLCLLLGSMSGCACYFFPCCFCVTLKDLVANQEAGIQKHGSKRCSKPRVGRWLQELVIRGRGWGKEEGWMRRARTHTHKHKHTPPRFFCEVMHDLYSNLFVIKIWTLVRKTINVSGRVVTAACYD